MKFSESIKEIAAAFAKAKGEIETPKHNKKVTVKLKDNKGQYDFWYTDLAGINDAIAKPFAKYGLLAISDVETVRDEQNRATVNVKTLIIHESGEYLESGVISSVAPAGIQDLGGLITYLKRYSLSALLGIATEADDDANGAAGNNYSTQTDKSPQAPKNANNGQAQNETKQTAAEKPATDKQKKVIYAKLKAISDSQNVELDKVYPRIQEIYKTDVAVENLSQQGASGLITELTKFEGGKSLY